MFLSTYEPEHATLANLNLTEANSRKEEIQKEFVMVPS